MNPTILLLLLTLICSAIFTIVSDAVLLNFFETKGIRVSKNNDAIRWASTAKPTIGGISFFLTFILALLAYALFYLGVGAPTGTSEVMQSEFLQLAGLTGVVILAFFIGLMDDAYNTRPFLKFLVQVTCGVIMIAAGVHIQLFNNILIDYPLTLFWVVGIMNSINLLDNMDGVTGTISLTVLISMLAVVFTHGGITAEPFTFVIIASCGTMIGFLFHNWKPAKLYMGDTGSQFLGALLAFVGIKFCWNIPVDETGAVAQSVQVLTPLLIFIVPIMDTTFVTVARIMRKQSPFVGGKDHLTHHLSYVGVPEKWVPGLLGLFGLLSGLLAVYFPMVENWAHSYSFIFAGYLVIAFVTFFLIYKRGERIGNIKERFSRTLARIVENKDREKVAVREKERPGQSL